MIVETGNPDVQESLSRTVEIITGQGGFVANDLIVREDNGELSCAIAEQPGVADRLLIDYSPTLTVPLDTITWTDAEDLLEPLQWPDHLSQPQQQLLEQWLTLVNTTGKIARIRQVLPRFAVTDWDLRHHIAQAGFPSLRTMPEPTRAKSIMVSWHSTSSSAPIDHDAEPQASGVTNTERLIPLKHLFNHDPEGAAQVPRPGRTAVVTSRYSDQRGTYENYGDLDALQLLVSFGYVDSRAPLVHSVPVSVEVPQWGRVNVEWRAPRYAVTTDDAPSLAPTEDGLTIRHLTARPDNRPRLVRLLALAGQSARGLSPGQASAAAEALIDSVAEANEAYYDRLDELVVEAMRRAGLSSSMPTVLTDVAAVSLLQRQRIRRFWG